MAIGFQYKVILWPIDHTLRFELRENRSVSAAIFGRDLLPRSVYVQQLDASADLPQSAIARTTIGLLQLVSLIPRRTQAASEVSRQQSVFGASSNANSNLPRFARQTNSASYSWILRN
jgi:hypothetical protein